MVALSRTKELKMRKEAWHMMCDRSMSDCKRRETNPNFVSLEEWEEGHRKGFLKIIIHKRRTKMNGNLSGFPRKQTERQVLPFSSKLLFYLFSDSDYYIFP